MKDKFNPTNEMIRAAEVVFICMTNEKIIREIVDGYQRKILAFWQFDNNKEVELCKKVGRDIELRKILEPKDSYLLDDQDFNIYLKECNEERIKAGLHVDNVEHCPLLVAEGLTRGAKRILVDSLQSFTGMDADTVISTSFTTYEKIVELSLTMLAPFVRSSKEIINEFINA